MTSARDHWNTAYAARGAEAVSWSDPAASESLPVVLPLLAPGDAILDVGGGASDLGPALVARGLGPVMVLDLSDTALDLARARAGAAAARIAFVQGDVTRWTPPRTFALWHDRAVFHFLTDPEDRASYVRTVAAALSPGGHAVISTFAADGPERCSGLPVARYSPEALAATLDALAPGLLAPVASRRFTHRTPGDADQRFQTSVLRRPA